MPVITSRTKRIRAKFIIRFFLAGGDYQRDSHEARKACLFVTLARLPGISTLPTCFIRFLPAFLFLQQFLFTARYRHRNILARTSLRMRLDVFTRNDVLSRLQPESLRRTSDAESIRASCLPVHDHDTVALARCTIKDKASTFSLLIKISSLTTSGGTVLLEVIIKRRIAFGAGFQFVEEIHHHFRHGHFIDSTLPDVRGSAYSTDTALSDYKAS
jgi:hypothetical protein